MRDEPQKKLIEIGIMIIIMIKIYRIERDKEENKFEMNK